jgi:hypothetical protein
MKPRYRYLPMYRIYMDVGWHLVLEDSGLNGIGVGLGKVGHIEEFFVTAENDLRIDRACRGRPQA